LDPDHQEIEWRSDDRAYYASMFEEGLVDLFLLAEAGVHVGSFYSNFRRLAMQLSGDPGGSYVSTDAKWCPYTVCICGWKGKRALHEASEAAEEWTKGRIVVRNGTMNGSVSGISGCAAPSPLCAFIRYFKGKERTQTKWDSLCDEMPTRY
jgi:hypothetical protein